MRNPRGVDTATSTLPRRVSDIVGQVDATVCLSAHTAHSGPDSQDNSIEVWPVPDTGVSDVVNSAVVLDSLQSVEVAGPRPVGSTSGTPRSESVGQERAGVPPPARILQLHAVLLSGTR